MATVTISRKQYEKLKHAAEVDEELVAKIHRALEDIRAGRIRVEVKKDVRG